MAVKNRLTWAGFPSDVPLVNYTLQDEGEYLKVLNPILIEPVYRVLFARILSEQPKTRPAWVSPDLYREICISGYAPEHQFDALKLAISMSLENEISPVADQIQDRKKDKLDVLKYLNRLAHGFQESIVGSRQASEQIREAIEILCFCQQGLLQVPDWKSQAETFGRVKRLIETDGLVPLGRHFMWPEVYVVYML